MAKKRCGAKTRAGGKCQAYAMPNGRCRLHGGMSTGPKVPYEPFGNKRNLTHGLYSSGLLDDEHDVYDGLSVGDLEKEIKMTRIMLKRAYDAQAAWLRNKEAGNEELELYETETHNIALPNGQTRSGRLKRIKRKRDFQSEIMKYTRTLADLEIKHAQLQSMKSGSDDMEDLRESLMKLSSAFDEPMKMVDPDEDFDDDEGLKVQDAG